MSSFLVTLYERTLKARRVAWHFRQGGLAQAQKHIRREKINAHFAGSAYRAGAQKNTSLRSDIAFGAVPAQIPSSRTASGFTLDFLPQDFPDFSPTFAQKKAAVILDNFSYTAWSHEFQTVQITPETWREIFEDEEIDFLLVESAWAGNGKTWQYHLTGPTAPRPAVVELLEYTKEHGIPSIFWNKEDPPHFEDFLETARLFDTVFTSDSNMVARYRERLGHENVFSLSFAAQPAVHNPVRPGAGVQERGVAFAGTYFAHKYPERREQMNVLLTGALDAAVKTGEQLEIFSRFIDEDAKYQFPAPFDSQVVGSLPYSKMLTAYQAYKVFLNVNSVVDSPSMCARRIFEILACGTPVVTTSSLAIPYFFNDQQIMVADDARAAALAIRALLNSPALREKMVHKAQREIWAKHTYAHRAAELLVQSGIDGAAYDSLALPKVSVISSTNRPQQMEHLFEQVGRQVAPLRVHGSDLEFAILAHGFEPDEAQIAELASRWGIDRVMVLQSPPQQSLGENLNALVEATEYEVVTKMDDDDFYGEHYLLDQLFALRFSQAAVVGKQAHFMYSGNLNVTLLRFEQREHRFTDFVMGPTITGYRRIFESIPFSHVSNGEDTDFLNRVVDSGLKIYSADKFNFVQMRAGQSHHHAWNVSDVELLASGSVQYSGLNTDHMMF